MAENEQTIVGQCRRCGIYLNEEMAQADGDGYDNICNDDFGGPPRNCRPIEKPKRGRGGGNGGGNGGDGDDDGG